MEKEKKIKDRENYERHFKKRVFVRELAGVYSDIYRDLLDQPRVYKPKSSRVINPQNTAICQALETQLNVFPPDRHTEERRGHGHMNSAVFYILEGKGYDVHDGIRYDWEAEDALIVENACVHRHVPEPGQQAKVLVVKSKPTFLFFNLLFQKQL